MKRHLGSRGRKIQCAAKAVIFDMDGVITNTMPDHFRAWQQVLREAGVIVSYFDVYRREGQRGITSLKEIFRVHKKEFHVAEANRLLARKEKIFKRIVKTRFIPGARNFLRFLSRQGFELALVTGTSRHELQQILPAATYSLFKTTVTGNDVFNGKPHPEPFRLALKLLKIKPTQAIVIENAPFGIQAAKAARLTCMAVETSLPRKFLKQADYIFSSISELRAKINFIRSA